MYNNNKDYLNNFIKNKELLINNYDITEDYYNMVKDKIIKYTDEQEALTKEREEWDKPPDVRPRTNKPPDVRPGTKKSSPQTDYFTLPLPKISSPGPPPQRKDYFGDKISDDNLKSLIKEAIRIINNKDEKEKLDKLSSELLKDVGDSIKSSYSQNIYAVKPDNREWMAKF